MPASWRQLFGLPAGRIHCPLKAGYLPKSTTWAVEAVGAGNTRRLVPVTVGIFNDNSGLVQVTGALTPGEQVVVPAT